MKGGAIQGGGAERIAKELVPVIEQFGGRVLIRAKVDSLVVENGRCVGVKMKQDERVIHVRRWGRVVSSIGYLNTVQKLLSNEICIAQKIPRSFDDFSTKPSSGFVIVNIGIAASPDELGLSKYNFWHIPVDAANDSMPPLKHYLYRLVI